MATIEDIVGLLKNAGIARGKCDSLVVDKSLDEQGLDSYDRMSLLFEIEQKYDVQLPTEVARTLKTLDDIVNHLNKED